MPKSDEMNVRDAVALLGRAEIAKAVGVQTKTITPAIRAGMFPSSWYIEVQKLAERKGVYLPVKLFNMKSGE